jgi:hypothetical protein
MHRVSEDGSEFSTSTRTPHERGPVPDRDSFKLGGKGPGPAYLEASPAVRSSSGGRAVSAAAGRRGAVAGRRGADVGRKLFPPPFEPALPGRSRPNRRRSWLAFPSRPGFGEGEAGSAVDSEAGSEVSSKRDSGGGARRRTTTDSDRIRVFTRRRRPRFLRQPQHCCVQAVSSSRHRVPSTRAFHHDPPLSRNGQRPSESTTPRLHHCPEGSRVPRGLVATLDLARPGALRSGPEL